MKKFLCVIIIFIFYLLGDARENDFQLDKKFDGWTPFLAVGKGEGKTPIEEHKEAIRKLGVYSDFIKTLIYNFSPDKKTIDLFTKIIHDLNNYNLQNVYELLPEEDKDNLRKIKFEGFVEDGNYVLKVAQPSKSVNDDEMSSLKFNKFGDFSYLLKIGHASNPQFKSNYLTKVLTKSTMTDTTYSQLTLFLKEVFKLAERSKELPQELIEQKRKITPLYPKLGDEDINLLTILSSSYPELHDRLLGIVQIHDLLTHFKSGDKEYTRINLKFGLHGPRIKKEFRKISNYLDRLHNLLDAYFKSVNEKGETIFDLRFISSDFTLEVTLLVKDGTILPADSNWCPISLDGLDFTKLNNLKATIKGELIAHFHGVNCEVKNIQIEQEYHRDKESAILINRFIKKPDVQKVKGRVYGIIPIWLIDVFIPSNIDTLVDDFAYVLAKGNNGKGTIGEFSYKAQEDGNFVFKVFGEGEALNNNFVSFGFNLMNKVLIPDDKTFKEALKFVRWLYDGFENDFKILASY